MSRQALPLIHPDRCTGCGRCVGACPPHVLWLAVQGPEVWGPKQAVLHNEPDCTGCARCVVVCPFDAIEMVRTGPPPR